MDLLFKKWCHKPINRKKRAVIKEFDICESLTDLIQEIQNLPCPLKETKNIVLSKGDFKSPLMFIGEAPGEEDNQQKKPFVGISGKLLNKMLVSIQINIEKIYMTHVFFWQTEESRSPTLQELKLTLPLVEKHILIQKPKLIVLLGAVATKSLLKTTEGILSIRGTFQQLYIQNEKFNVFITCHPSYILRTHKIKEYLEDFKKIKEYLEQNNLYNLLQ
jgi:uracil-DNA glycosylase